MNLLGNTKPVSKFPFHSILSDDRSNASYLLSKRERARALEVKTLKLSIKDITDFQLRKWY